MELGRSLPQVGMILMCDFEAIAFKEPEIVKCRPVIVLTKPRHGLITVVPLSTTAPTPQSLWHCIIEPKDLPRASLFTQASGHSWVKGDILHTLRCSRFSYIEMKGKNKKKYPYTRILPEDVMNKVRCCILHGLNLNDFVARLLDPDKSTPNKSAPKTSP